MKRPLAAIVPLALAFAPTIARADHVPGHGASEAVRNLNTLGGGTGAAVSRIMLLQELSRTKRNSLAPHSAYVTSLLGEYAPHPWFSFGAQVPLQIIDEDAQRTKVGLGNLRVLTRVTLHADKLFHRVLSFGVNATFPTRTVTFSVDPGKTWIAAPYVVFTRTHDVRHVHPFWQVLGTLPIETRPAGTAIDLGAGAQGGVKLGSHARRRVRRDPTRTRRGLGTLAPSAGLLATVRLASWCRAPHGGASFCREGRVTELAREVGSTSLYATVGVAWSFAPWGAINAAMQVPLTPKRDFDLGGSIGLQAAF